VSQFALFGFLYEYVEDFLGDDDECCFPGPFCSCICFPCMIAFSSICCCYDCSSCKCGGEGKSKTYKSPYSSETSPSSDVQSRSPAMKIKDTTFKSVVNLEIVKGERWNHLNIYTHVNEDDTLVKGGYDVVNQMNCDISWLTCHYRSGQVKYLNVSDNDIGSIRDITTMPNLRYLLCPNNDVSGSLRFAMKHESLQFLDLNNNDITRIQGRGQLSALEVLLLRDNEIESIDGMVPFPKLRILDLANNSLKSLSFLAEDCSKLQYINLQSNDIRCDDGAHRDFVKNCTNLKFMDIRDNDIAESHFREMESLLKDKNPGLRILSDYSTEEESASAFNISLEEK